MDALLAFLVACVPPIIFAAIAIIIIRMGNVVRYIPNDNIGVVEKVWSIKGSVTSGFIALNGEAGFQPEILRGGLHFFFPFMYRIHIDNLVMIGQGKVGYVYARDGLPLAPSQTLASNAAATDFQDTRAFLGTEGQKGPQRQLLREGVHALNLAQFIVLTEDSIYAVKLNKDEAAIPGCRGYDRNCNRP